MNINKINYKINELNINYNINNNQLLSVEREVEEFKSKMSLLERLAKELEEESKSWNNLQIKCPLKEIKDQRSLLENKKNVYFIFPITSIKNIIFSNNNTSTKLVSNDNNHSFSNTSNLIPDNAINKNTLITTDDTSVSFSKDFKNKASKSILVSLNDRNFKKTVLNCTKYKKIL